MTNPASPFDSVPTSLNLNADHLPKYPFDPEADTKAAQQRRWEHRVVGTMLKHYGLLRQASSMAAEIRERTGQGRLTFEIFRQFHPSFPTWLTAEKVPYVHQITMSDFIKGFKKTKLFKAYVDSETNSPEWVYEGGHHGLVFEWLHVCPMMILHNNYRSMRESETVIFHPIKLHDQLMAIQSFTSFLDTLPWSPD